MGQRVHFTGSGAAFFTLGTHPSLDHLFALAPGGLKKLLRFACCCGGDGCSWSWMRLVMTMAMLWSTSVLATLPHLSGVVVGPLKKDFVEIGSEKRVNNSPSHQRRRWPRRANQSTLWQPSSAIEFVGLAGTIGSRTRRRSQKWPVDCWKVVCGMILTIHLMGFYSIFFKKTRWLELVNTMFCK